MSAERLMRFDSVAAAYVREGRVAGVVALVLRGGQVAYEGVHGVLDIVSHASMRRDAIFRIASMTKPITSVAVMMLVEEGRLALSDPVARYIPAFEHTLAVVQDGDSVRIVPAERAITILDLLTHTAGIPYPDEQMHESLRVRYREASLESSLLNSRDEPMGILMGRLAGLPFTAQPGERFVYGYATDLLGVVVERVSGMTLDDFFRRRIFEPLRMHDTHFFLPAEKADRLAAVHSPREGGGLVRGRDDDIGWTGQGAFARGPQRVYSGGAGLLSTAQDYARFLQMLLNQGELDGVRLLTPATVRQMTANQVGDLYAEAEGYPGIGFGLGFEIKIDPEVGGFDIPPSASPGAFGWGGAAYTTFWVDPAYQLVALFMAQLRPYREADLSKRFGDIVYDAILAPAP